MKILIPILLLFFIVGCAASNVVCPDGTVVENAADCPAPVEELEEIEEVVEEVEEVVEEMDEDLDPEVQKLVDKNAKVKSLSFTYAGSQMVGTDQATLTKRTFITLNDKVKVEEFILGNYDRDTFADTVYLDLSAKTAQGYCTGRSWCEEEPEKRRAKFADFDITYPLEWIDHLPASAVVWGNRQFEGSDMPVVRYEKDGLHYEVLMQSFYGVPVRVAAYKDSNYATLDHEFEYRDMAFNLVTEADVTQPE